MRLASLPLCLLLTLLAGMTDTTLVSAPSQVISTTPDFTMSANPDTLSIPAGSSGTSTITLVSIDGFNGSVSLSAPSPLCPSPQCTTWEISPSNVIVALTRRQLQLSQSLLGAKEPLATSQCTE